MLDLQLSCYRHLYYNSRALCPLLLFLGTKSAILAGAYSYFVVSSLKCEGKNKCLDLFPNPLILDVMCTYRGSDMAPTLRFLGAERVLQRLRGVRGQDDATETGRRATSRAIVVIVKNRILK